MKSSVKSILGPLWQLSLWRLREIAREPGTLFWVFGFPVLLAAFLGVAFSEQSPPRLVVAVLDPTSAASIAIARTLTVAGIEARRLPDPVARQQLRGGQVSLVVSPPGAGGPLSYRFDPTRPEAQLARVAVNDALQRAAGRLDPLALEERVVREPGARYIDFLVPGLIGMNVMSGSMWGLGFVIVNMRVRKTLKRLVATPVRRWQLLMSQVFARLLVIPFEVGALLLFARLAFRVQMEGAVAALAAITLAGAVSFGGLAVLLSCRAQNPETVTGLMNVVMLPMFMLSGVFFSSTRFPEVARPVVSLLPLTALNDSLRAVIIDGAALSSQGRTFVVLACWGAVGWLIGLRFFRWT